MKRFTETNHEMTIDLFAGGGGASTGIELATGHPVGIAVNHCPAAIEMHKANHPNTIHHLQSIYDVDPTQATQGAPVDVLWASPSCTHFSRARGAKPVSKQLRGLGWMIVKWAARTNARCVIAENVTEWETWGPVRRGRPVKAHAGKYFQQMVAQLRALGYNVEWKSLIAADYGAPTLRKRLFLVARKDAAPVWPEATHGKGTDQPHRTAAECIDWSDLGNSIFERKKPLAQKTCERIAKGIVRYVLEAKKPFILGIDNQSNSNGTWPVDAPLGTVTMKNRYALVSGFIAKHYGGVIGHGVERPLGTITAVDHHSLVAATLCTMRGGSSSHRHGDNIQEPLRTISASGTHHALVAAFLTSYYSNGKTGSDLRDPMPSVVSKGRHGLVTMTLEGKDYVMTDIKMRMLQPRELARAQGFPDDYILTGTKTAQIARIGNSVCPPIAQAIVAAQGSYKNQAVA